MSTVQLIAAILGCSGIAALINKIFDHIQAKREHRWKKEDAKETKEEIDIQGIKRAVDALTVATKYNMQDRIRYLGQGYLAAGSITYEDRELLMHMHEAYHALGGNGNLDRLMSQVMGLPLKINHEEASHE